MFNKNIAVIIGRLRQDSFNAKLANALIKLAPTGVIFNILKIKDLPFLQPK